MQNVIIYVAHKQHLSYKSDISHARIFIDHNQSFLQFLNAKNTQNLYSNISVQPLYVQIFTNTFQVIGFLSIYIKLKRSSNDFVPYQIL